MIFASPNIPLIGTHFVILIGHIDCGFCDKIFRERSYIDSIIRNRFRQWLGPDVTDDEKPILGQQIKQYF